MIPLQSVISSKGTDTPKSLLGWMGFLLFLIFALPNQSAQADLLIEAFRITDALGMDTTQFTPGETFQIHTNVWNKGRTVSSETTLRYYLSTNTDISPEDTEVASDRVKALSGRGAYSPRRRAELSKTLTAPDTPGIYYYGVCVDAVEGETDIRNNCSQSIAIRVTAPSPPPVVPQVPDPADIQGPDLVFSTARVERNIIKLGWGVKLHFIIMNQGTTTADSTVIRFYRSEDATISSEDTELHVVRISQLGVGKRIITWASLPGPTALGMFYYGMCIDGVASEANTANNCSAAFEVTVEPQSGGTPVLVPVGTIRTQVLGIEGTPAVIDVAENFLGNVARYTARSSEPEVVSVDMSKSEVTLTPGDKGWARVTVTAFSGDLAAKHTFFATVGGVDPPGSGDLFPEVSIPDAALRSAIRATLGLAADAPITQQQMAGLTALDAGQQEIQDLTGLEYAVSLTRLILDMNHIRDLLPLAKLTPLLEVSLDANEISDLTSLAGLTQLTSLSLRGNQITDISALADLTSLRELYLSGNERIVDLSLLRRLEQKNPGISIDISTSAAPAPSIAVLPFETALLPNYPNPFNPETWIPYQLDEAAEVTVTLYNVQGVVVRRLDVGHRPAGFYQSRARSAYWDGRNQFGEPVANGLYFYTLTAGEFTATRKMIVRK